VVQFELGPLSLSRDIEATLQVEDKGWFSEVNIEWSLYGTDTLTWQSALALNPETDFVNSNDQIKFILRRLSLTHTGSYRLNLRLYAKHFDSPVVYNQDNVLQVVTPPVAGVLEVGIDRGEAMSDVFEIAALSWTSFDRRPLLY
jgi:hypothetical protein